MKRDQRGSWYLLTGIVLGVGLGLLYSWIVSPVKYIDAPPYALREDYKDEYRALIAAAYLYDGDLARAQDRLAQLNDEETAQSMTIKAQQALAQGYPEEEVRALGILALALGQGITPEAPTPFPTQTITSTPVYENATPTPLFIEETPQSSLQP